ncbi:MULTISPECIES: ribonuclease Z [Pontibacillus]|uniref:Ribonuclease Z n=1 Tax=Pontibacillus chungwhensis TaxID=265426 RepID=A0ABY8UXW7_9BACI|nr:MULTISPECIES: ribonuclease Z [Pontibacillus]MCD5323102.1 ribonuclease Z [Pontibacillus sp. HN14]WIF96491.1 ribonuclease Z [Pontibacillus chungwhensis]
MEFIFLGTGAGVPSKKRNVTSIALQLLQERGATWLIDCGEATQHQILNTSIRPRRIEKIFITHLHGDHIFGLPGLLGSRSFQGGTTPLEIYGPRGIKAFIETALSISSTRLTYDLQIHEIDEGKIYEDDQFTITCKKLDHGILSYGYSFEEKDKPGELLVKQLQKSGIQPGPIYQQIKDNPRVMLEDGTMIEREDYVGPPKKGRKVCVFGDTRFHERFIPFVKDADVLVHEATFSENEETLAYNYYHSTTAQAARIAQEGGVKQLIMTHISSRYQDEDVNSLLNEARTYFSNTDIAADLKQFKVRD